MQSFKRIAVEKWTLDDHIENSKSFMVLNKIFKIIKIIPNSNATAERSFSILRRVKSYLRSTMQQERLQSLLLLAANTEVTIDPKEVFNLFVDAATRKHDFIKFD